MVLAHLFLLVLLALLVRIFPLKKIRKWLLLVSSAVLIFWLQPSLPIRYLDFYLPVILLCLIVVSWYFLSNPGSRKEKVNLVAIAVILLTAVVLNLTRYFSLTGILTASRPPNLLFLAVACLALLMIGLLMRNLTWQNKFLWGGMFVILIALMVIVKNPSIRLFASHFLRTLQGQNQTFATSFDIQWLGFSYVVFRLIHTIKDYQSGRLKDCNLLTYVNYMLFFPAYLAGPIDRIQHFEAELSIENPLNVQQLGEAAWRLALGIFKKFAIADTLAILSLNTSTLSQVNHAGFVWLAVYAYAFQILFDFSGYTDIAIGLALVLGIKLPENFNNPYLKPNLKLFWDNWHITLTQWFRTYYFNPISRKIRRNWKKVPAWVMVLFMQISTMVLIGFWHGVSWNFLIWGLWHGIGMFLYSRWNEWFSPRVEQIKSPWLKKLIPLSGVIFTFHFVALGWVWFALPSPAQSLAVISRMLGG